MIPAFRGWLPGRVHSGRLWALLVFLIACLTGARVEAQPKDPGSEFRERVSIFAGGGGLFPTGDFGDAVDAGYLFTFGGYYRLTPHFRPVVSFEQGFLRSKPEATGTGRSKGIDLRSLQGGLRVYLLPEESRVRVWGEGLVGWAHYTSNRAVGIDGVFAERRDDRDDVRVSGGGGVEVHLFWNVSVAANVRGDFSFSTRDDPPGEKDLRSVTALGLIVLHY